MCITRNEFLRIVALCKSFMIVYNHVVKDTGSPAKVTVLILFYFSFDTFF